MRGSTRPVDRRGAMSAQISQRLFLRRWSSGRAPVSKTGEWGSIPHRRAIPVSSSGREASSERMSARCQRANPSSNLGAGSTFFVSSLPLSPCLADRSRHRFSKPVKQVRFLQHGPCPRHLTDRIRDYESRHGGSNPPEGAIFFCCGHLVDRIPPSEGGDGGSSPPCSATSIDRGSSTGQSGRLLPGRLWDRSPPPTPFPPSCR